MKKLLSFVLALGIAGSVAIAGAQQTGGGASPDASPRTVPPSAGEAVMTIDCPPSAAAQAGQSVPSASPVGTPQGTGSGSGIDARPSKGAVQHVEGEIKQIDSSRTERAIEVGDAKLWVEPSTAILLNCQNASLADLKPGTPVKAAYEEKDGRKVARVIEARPR